jgi:hypothetical protein
VGFTFGSVNPIALNACNKNSWLYQPSKKFKTRINKIYDMNSTKGFTEQIELHELREKCQKLEWKNKALREALQYLVDTKKRKDTVGKDSIYMQRKNFGWMKAKKLLESE